MTNSTPPDQRPPRLRDDEPIALLVTFLAFGTIFWWALSQRQGTWDLSSLLPGLSSSPSPTVSPIPSTTPSDSALSNQDTTTVAPTNPSPSPQPTVGNVLPESQITPTPQPTVSPTNPTATVITPTTPTPTKPSNPAVGKGIVFPDVPSNYWAAPFITALSARGIIGGFPDGTFRPNQPVTRAQYAVQLQKAFTKPDRRPTKQFTDVPANSLWATAVDQAVKANFMSGYPEGDFRPEQEVSRVEAVASMVQGLSLKQPADPEAILQAYADREKVPGWARDRVAAAIQAGIFSGDPDTQLLNPTQPATRADIAALVFKSLELSEASR